MVASSVGEENTIEGWLGEEVEPGRSLCDMPKKLAPQFTRFHNTCRMADQISCGRDIFQHIVNLLPRANWKGTIDELLLKRREVEFQLFEKIEQNEVLPISAMDLIPLKSLSNMHIPSPTVENQELEHLWNESGVHLS